MGGNLPRVGGTVCTGDLDGSRACIASASDFELEAGHVELLGQTLANFVCYVEALTYLSTTNASSNVKSCEVIRDIRDTQVTFAYR